MLLLSARDLARQFDVDPVFQGVTFDVRAGEKIGLVGPNGCGKTTLLSILAGEEEPDVGEVERPPSVSVGYLEQQADHPTDHTLLEEARQGLAALYALQETAHRLADEMAGVTDEGELARLHQRYDAIHQQLERHDAYHVEHRVDEVLQGLGFAREDYDRRLATFSGGQQNRAGLARILLGDLDLLLLDEPTNHLDIETTEWLERYLSRSAAGMVIVSHDRYFLDRVTTRTIELWQGGVTDFTGNFTAYWRQRAERMEVLRRTWEKQQEFIARTEDFIRRNAYGQKATQAKDREKKLQRLDRVTLPPDFSELPMGFPEPTRTGDWVLRTERLGKGFGSNAASGDKSALLFSDFTVQVDRGDRVGILGPNGSGKTTLLRTIVGELAPDVGSVKFGTGVSLGYFDQQLASVESDLDAVEAVRAPAEGADSVPLAQPNPDLKPGSIRALLAKFGVSGELGLQRVEAMSGGERTKVALARLVALRPNLMILDEPTNHLDFWAASALERSLREYSGTVLFVSHDRYFVDQIATKVIVLEPDGWRLHEGNYTQYQQFLEGTGRLPSGKSGGASAAPSIPAAAASTKPETAEPKTPRGEPPRRKRKFPYRPVEDIEADIAECEADIASLEADLANPSVHRDATRIRQVHVEYAAAQEDLARLMEHWEEALELN